MSNKVQQEHSVNKTFWLVLWLIVVVLVYHFPEKMINPYLNTHTTCWIFYLKQCCRLVVKLLFHCGLFWSTMYKFLHFWGCTNKNQKLEFTLRVHREARGRQKTPCPWGETCSHKWLSVYMSACPSVGWSRHKMRPSSPCRLLGPFRCFSSQINGLLGFFCSGY